MSGRKALITGITGQDGSYLAELLIEKGYEVYGIVRRLSTPNLNNLENVASKVVLLGADLLDQSSLDSAVKSVAPDEVYNLGAQSFVGASFTQPVLTAEVTGLGAIRMLEAVRRNADKARFYQASSSEMFGNAAVEPQNESTPLLPRSPYGVSKVFAHLACRNYRETYGMFVSTGILFNHESERRGLEFVTRTISNGVARIAAGLDVKVPLGDISAARDWGYAPDDVEPDVEDRAAPAIGRLSSERRARPTRWPDSSRRHAMRRGWGTGRRGSHRPCRACARRSSTT